MWPAWYTLRRDESKSGSNWPATAPGCSILFSSLAGNACMHGNTSRQHRATGRTLCSVARERLLMLAPRVSRPSRSRKCSRAGAMKPAATAPGTTAVTASRKPSASTLQRLTGGAYKGVPCSRHRAVCPSGLAASRRLYSWTSPVCLWLAFWAALWLQVTVHRLSGPTSRHWTETSSRC